MGRKIDITGQNFGRLTAIRDVESIGKGRRWECQCTCGKTTIVNLKDLRRGDTKSCGCINRERMSALGRKNAPILRELHKSPLEKRFWKHVDQINRPEPTVCHGFGQCLIWTGALNGDGRGSIGFEGGTKLATHAAWFLAYGYWPAFLCHACDNKACVNVNHLFEGNAAVNMYDWIAKEKGGVLVDFPFP